MFAMLKLVAEEQGVTFHSQMGSHLWIQERPTQVNIRVSSGFSCTLEKVAAGEAAIPFSLTSLADDQLGSAQQYPCCVSGLR